MNEFRREFLQELDGRRPQGDDAIGADETISDDPRLAAELQSRRAFDRAVAQAFEQVPLPLGLAARLAATLEAEAATERSGLLAPAASTAPAAAPHRQSPYSRRHWLAATGSALAATAAGGALFVWWQKRRSADLTVEQVLEASLVFHQRAAAKRGEAQPISLAPPPADFPLSDFVRPHAEPRVRKLDEPLLGRTGFVYELAPADGPRASLYVLHESPQLSLSAVPLLPNAPMAHPFKTGGCAMSAWREANRMVLLAVDGDERRYREYLAAPQEFA
jgi:hypothetical protein